MTRTLFVIVLLLLVPRVSIAQSTPSGEPPPNVRLRIGPLYANPTLALTNAGVDTNVFNEADQTVPKRDFTLTVTPATDLWIRFGRTWFNGNIREDLVYYSKYESERSANTSYKVNWLIPLNRLTFNPGMTYLRTRERPGFEIDARSQRTEVGYSGAVEVRALSKTFFGGRIDRRTIRFDQDAFFLGTNLRDQLNRTVTSAGFNMRTQVTALTSLTLDVARSEDRFEFTRLRDSNSTAVTGGVSFDPFALIKGTARIGYRNFQPTEPGVPGYQGSIAAVDLSYVALGTTKLGVQATRDVQYSYEINQPYYIQTGVSGSIQQQIFGPLDVTARVGAQRLEYTDRAGAAVPVSNRIDQVRSYGAGIGYHIGRDIRIGFNVDRQHRSSDVAFRQYGGLRYGFAMTYGS